MTMGDPAGVGPDLALLVWNQRNSLCLPFVWIGKGHVLEERARLLGLEVPLRRVFSPHEAVDCFSKALPFFELEGPMASVLPGVSSLDDAPIVLSSIEQAVDWALSRSVLGVVTNPISKKTLYRCGFTHEGHTDYLAELCAQRTQTRPTPVMMLEASGLRTVPLTIHIPISQVSQNLRKETIIDQVEVLCRDLRRYLKIEAPRIAVCGLNPHAGEEGGIGREEITVIAPAIEVLKSRGHRVCGPLSADSLFYEAFRRSYDAIVCMYHDQALIPVKMLDFYGGVNVTLGLPFLRTSPDHGTAFALAGSGKARPESLLAALRWLERAAGSVTQTPPERDCP